MTIYLVQWQESNVKKSYATANFLDAKLKYKDVLAGTKLHSSVTVGDRDDAITKIQIKTQKEVIDLINKL